MGQNRSKFVKKGWYGSKGVKIIENGWKGVRGVGMPQRVWIHNSQEEWPTEEDTTKIANTGLSLVKPPPPPPNWNGGLFFFFFFFFFFFLIGFFFFFFFFFFFICETSSINTKFQVHIYFSFSILYIYLMLECNYGQSHSNRSLESAGNLQINFPQILCTSIEPRHATMAAAVILQATDC